MSYDRQEIPVTKNCPIHGAYNGIMTVYKLPFADKVTLNPFCPICAKEEYTARAAEMARRKMAKCVNIGDRFKNACFENFDAYTTELAYHLDRCKKFALNPKGALIMLGEHGNGKTHLAVSILKMTGGAIYTAYEAGMKIRRSYSSKSSNEYHVFNELYSTPLLVIDELEKTKESAAKNQWLSQIVGKRYNNMLPLIIIANCHTKQDCNAPEKPCPKCLEYHLENDVISRLLEDSILMKFNGADYRTKIRDGIRNNGTRGAA